MKKLLNETIENQVREALSGMKEPVQVLFFGAQQNCPACEDTRQLIEEVAALSDKIHLGIHDLEADAALAAQHGVDKAPGLVIAAKDGETITDYGVRLSGIPAGHEFTTLIHDLLIVSGRDSGLSATTREFLKTLEKPVHLQVFVTPTCPYCPRAVLLAHMMAVESPLVQAEMIEATEFPALASRHRVSGVPQTTINDGAGHVVGAVPEQNLVAAIREAIG